MNLLRIVLASTTLAICCESAAQDVTTFVREGTLNEFASALAAIGGSGEYTYSPNLPKLVASQPAEGNAKPSNAAITRRVVWEPYPVRTCAWEWRLTAPRFAITPAGVKFLGDLVITAGKRSWLQHVQLPVTVQYNSTAARVDFTASDSPINVLWPTNGGGTSLGTISIGTFVSTSLSVGSKTFSVGGRSITGSVVNVSIQYSSGMITITNDVKF